MRINSVSFTANQGLKRNVQAKRIAIGATTDGANLNLKNN